MPEDHQAPPDPVSVSALPQAPTALGVPGQEVGQDGGEPPCTAQTPAGVQGHPRGGGQTDSLDRHQRGEEETQPFTTSLEPLKPDPMRSSQSPQVGPEHPKMLPGMP